MARGAPLSKIAFGQLKMEPRVPSPQAGWGVLGVAPSIVGVKAGMGSAVLKGLTFSYGVQYLTDSAP